MALENPTEGGNLAKAPVPKAKFDQKQVILLISRIWAWAFLFLLTMVFWLAVYIVNDGEVNFLSLRNSQNILMAITPVLLMGLGQTFVIISSGIDLSVGWVMGLASVVAALVIRDLVGEEIVLNLFGQQLFHATISQEVAIFFGFGAGLIAAAIPGFINGVIIAKLKVPSFIVTLGMSFIARGAAYMLSDGNVVGGQPPGVRNFGNEALIYVLRGEGGGWYFFKKPDVTGEALRHLDRIFQWPVVVTVIVVAIAIFILHRTQFGRHTFAIGGNPEAASRAGVPVDRHKIMLYTLSAVTAGLAGVLHTARFAGGSAVAGDPLLLSSIAAVIIGGVSMFGGYGTVIGTAIGALIIAVLTTGLVMLNVSPYWQFIVVGVVVILAVLIDQARDIVVGRMEREST